MTHNFTHHVETEITGSRRMSCGEPDEDFEEVAFCFDCGREISDAEIAQDMIDRENPTEAAGFETIRFDDQGHLHFVFAGDPEPEPANLCPGVVFCQSPSDDEPAVPGSIRTVVSRRINGGPAHSAPIFFTPEDFGESSVAPWEA